MSSEPGIDYGMGRTNIDARTGCRYGIISLHSLGMDVIENFEPDYGDPACPKCQNALTEYSEYWKEYPEEDEGEYKESSSCCCADFVCRDCRMIVDSDAAYPEEPMDWYVDDEDYTLRLDSNNDVWVFKSPFYTYCQFASPCAPGAGHLDHSCDEPGAAKTYCLGPEWFEDGKLPYKAFLVK